MKKQATCLLSVISIVCLGVGNALAAEIKPIVPNDTFYSYEWEMDEIHAPEAWAEATSSGRDVIVAVIDSGMDETHPDLKGILWTNPNDPTDGKDNDNDGYIDDTHGWNFANNTSSTRPMNGSLTREDSWDHGTIVASLIAARGNDDIGIAGMAWKTKIMPLVILDTSGYGGTDRLAKAIKYATDHHADIINLSLEGNSFDQQVADQIKMATAKGDIGCDRCRQWRS